MSDWPFGELTPGAYGIVVADPSWKFQNWNKAGERKGAAHHYDCMPLDDIKALPVRRLARKDGVLLLWTTGWAMATGQAQEVARAWGATPVTEMVWNKTTVNGLLRWGLGYRARSMHEPILIATWGNPKHKAFPSSFFGEARQHSRKPFRFYEIVRQCTPGLLWRCDLFNCEARHGFEGWNGKPHRRYDEEASPPLAALHQARQARIAAGPV